MAVSLARPGPRQRPSVIRAPGMRGLTHWWPLDDAFGGFSYPRVGPIYATNTATNPVAGPPFAGPGQAAYLSSSSASILLSGAPHSNGNAAMPAFSVCFWLYLNSLSSRDSSAPRYICWGAATGDNNEITLGSTAGAGDLAVRIVSGGSVTLTGVSASSTLATGKWYHIAMTWDGGSALSNVVAYLNGVVLSISNGGNVPTTANTFGIGCRDAAARIIDGRMADVRYYRGTVLGADEIAALYNSAFLPKPFASFVGVAAAGGSFIPAWAMNSNLPVIGTGTY